MYEVNFKLGKVIHVASKYEEFKFTIQTVKPSFIVTDFGLRSNGQKDKMILSGTIETADIEASAQVEKLLAASENNKSLPVTWQHNDAAKTHNFTVNDIDRGSSALQLQLSWNGNPLDIGITGSKTIEVPAAGDFKVMNVMAMNDAEQYASVQFSDPVAVGQELTGLITVSNQADITYTINGSEVKLYAGDKMDGDYTINVNPGIKTPGATRCKKAIHQMYFLRTECHRLKYRGAEIFFPTPGAWYCPLKQLI